MSFPIPAPLREEHEELHERLIEATEEPGAVGEAALEVARLLIAHLAREEELALPALGLMADVVRGALRADMAPVVPLARRLKAELPSMFAEHRQILAALESLAAAARAAGLREHERFAIAMMRHVQLEELVLYPAAVLLGEHVERALGDALV